MDINEMNSDTDRQSQNQSISCELEISTIRDNVVEKQLVAAD